MTHPSLARSLSTADAVFIGLGSMIGAGVFAVFPEAARSAGAWLLVGLALAGFVALANATSSAQLAARYPTSGGTYVYGREVLGQRWGFAAGWSFLIGKTASVAAMALTFATYVVPEGWRGVTAAIVVAVMAGVNYVGVAKTAFVTKVLVVITLAALTVAVFGMQPVADSASLLPDLGAFPGGYEVLQSAALLFFAFAGYARIATMGEEVKDPTRAIPRAIVTALLLVLVTYTVVALALLRAFPAEVLALTPDPLAAGVAHHPVLAGIVRFGAITATLGALLGLIAGVGRTSLAMARGGDLPASLTAVHPRFQTPHRAEVLLAGAVILIVLTVDLRGAIGFSSFGVLLYYAIANISAFRQPASERRYPRLLQILGLAGCLLLAVAVPWQSLLAGAGVLGAGLIGREAIRRVGK